MELKNKTIVITGASKGLGKTLAEHFILEGSNVVICSTKEAEIKKTAEEIGVLGICADVTKEEDMTRLLNETIKNFGKVDIWINNAGTWLAHSFAEDFDMDKVQKMLDVNILGTINGARVALRHMKNNGSGTILNVISDSALIGRPMSSMYCASKWAVNGFTKSIREENPDIQVLSIFPGGIQTSIFNGGIPQEKFDNFMTPQHVAERVIKNLKLSNPDTELSIKKE